MALGAAYEDDAIQALANSPTVPKPAPEKASVWRTLPEAIGRTAAGVGMGVGEAAAEIAATSADILGGLRYMRDATPEQRRQIDRQGIPISAYSSDVGDALRAGGKTLRADPATASAAEQIVQGFARGATKIVGGAVLAGPVGVLAAGAEEAVTRSDELRLQGVDFNTRTKAGAVQGAGLALAALPLVGQTKLATAGLYAIGGPGGFIAQQAATREILQGAGYDKIGAQFDPFDPVGLAVAALLPAGFAAYGLRQQKLQRAVDSLPDLPSRADAAPPAAEPAPPAPFPSRSSAIADAVRAYPTEAVDAARVVLLAERRAAANPGAADNLRALDQHETALARAEDQLAAGDAVQVADVAPAPRVPTVETPEFRAWFDGSRVVTPEGAPMVLYHGTAQDFSAFDAAAPRAVQADDAAQGFYFTRHADDASGYATGRAGRDGANVQPVYVALRNPYDWPATDLAPSIITPAKRAELEAAGYDGIIYRDGDEVIAFRPEQVKSAIGNSGAFDPTTGSLTDSPYASWADQITAAIREMQAQARPTDAPTTPQAANPEAAAPARGAGEPPAAAGAADAGRPAGVEAAGVTPEQARAVAETAKADVIALRKRESVLQSLLECLSA